MLEHGCLNGYYGLFRYLKESVSQAEIILLCIWGN